VGFVVDKVALGQVFSEYFGFLCHLHSTKFPIIIITRGRYNRPFSGRRAEWTQLGLHPHYAKKTCCLDKVKCCGVKGNNTACFNDDPIFWKGTVSCGLHSLIYNNNFTEWRKLKFRYAFFCYLNEKL
jgi:hypothetical protein